jgi:hypothetical protein
MSKKEVRELREIWEGNTAAVAIVLGFFFVGSGG